MQTVTALIKRKMRHTFIGSVKLVWRLGDDDVVNEGAQALLHPWRHIGEDERLLPLLKVTAQALHTLRRIKQ